MPCSTDPELHMDVCTYLAPLDEKEVQRNWLFLGREIQGEVAPHIWKLFGSLSGPSLASNPAAPCLEGVIGGVCAVKLVVERVP